MKITGLKSTIVAVPCRKPYPSSIGILGVEPLPSVIVEVFTDEGKDLIGVGESPVISGAEITKLMVDSAEPIIKGEDPFDVQSIMKKLYSRFNLIHFNLHAGNWALSGIEMALWDIIGKACDKPLYKLWGGAIRKKIAFWAWIARDSLENMRSDASNFLEDGFTTLYTKVGIDPKQDVESVKALRDAANNFGNGDIKIRVDANQAWTPSTAIKVIKKMEEYDIEFVEQPVLMYNLDALASVRRRVETPILSHESSWTFYDSLNVIKKEAADAIQLDPRFDAGFYGVRIAAGMAEAAGMSSVMHSFGELGITLSAVLHLVASSPSFIHANQTVYYIIADDVIRNRLKFDSKGCIDVPEGRGLGVELDREKIKKYNELYLSQVKPTEFQKSRESPRKFVGLPEYEVELVPMASRF